MENETMDCKREKKDNLESDSKNGKKSCGCPCENVHSAVSLAVGLAVLAGIFVLGRSVGRDGTEGRKR